MLVILVRHGETAGNNPANPIVRGWHDNELTPQGRIDAQITANRLKQYSPQYLYHSDFMRDSETGHIIARALNIPAEADFYARTWDTGQFSNRPETEVNEAIIGIYKRPWESAPGGSETFNEFLNRWIEFLESKMEAAACVDAMRPIVIVTHGRNLAAAQAHFQGINNLDSRMPMPAGFATVEVAQDRSVSMMFHGKTEPIIADV